MFRMHFQRESKSASVGPLRWLQDNGVDYKVKLIGVREIIAPGDDTMCQVLISAGIITSRLCRRR